MNSRFPAFVFWEPKHCVVCLRRAAWQQLVFADFNPLCCLPRNVLFFWVKILRFGPDGFVTLFSWHYLVTFSRCFGSFFPNFYVTFSDKKKKYFMSIFPFLKIFFCFWRFFLFLKIFSVFEDFFPHFVMSLFPMFFFHFFFKFFWCFCLYFYVLFMGQFCCYFTFLKLIFWHFCPLFQRSFIKKKKLLLNAI